MGVPTGHIDRPVKQARRKARAASIGEHCFLSATRLFVCRIIRRARSSCRLVSRGDVRSSASFERVQAARSKWDEAIEPLLERIVEEIA
jgi:hypothetical protein